MNNSSCDARGTDEAKTLPLPTGYVKSLALSPDGKLIAAGHYQALTLIDRAAWSVKRDVGSHTGYVTGVSLLRPTWQSPSDTKLWALTSSAPAWQPPPESNSARRSSSSAGPDPPEI